MHASDSPAFIERLIIVAELFDATLSTAKQKLYFDALKDLPIEDVIGSLNVAARACTFMPKPAELRKLAVGDDEDAAERAWLALRGAMRTAGAYRSLATADPALGEVIIALFGGWPEACHSDFTPEMWSSKRKEFGRVYRVFRDRSLTGTRYLQGLCEQQNGRRQEWLKFIDVAVLSAQGDLRLLRGDQADAYRTTIAAGQSSTFAQLTAGVTAMSNEQGA